MEMPPVELADHTRALMRVLAPLRPLVVYFRQVDVRQAIRTIFEARGPDWAAYQTGWKLASPYAIRRHLAGVEGLAAMYADYRDITDSLFAGLECPKLAIETDGGEWDVYYGQIAHALERAKVPI